MIRIDTLGPIEVTVDGAPAPRELLWRKNLGLLLYLARSRARRTPRDRLMGMLWGDKPEADARHSLNEALRVIRKSLPPDALSSDGDLLRLEDGAVSVDVDDFESMLEEGLRESASGLIRGEFAEGFTIPDSNEFEDWLSAERAHWRRQGAECLVTIGDAQLSEGDALAARDTARRAARLDPLAEAPAGLLIRCDAVSGDPSAAVATFRVFADRLERELGLEPPAALVELLERIREQREVAHPEMRAEEPGLSRRLPLAGRGAQLKTAMGVLHAGVGAAEPRLLVLLGGSGTGKTRLAEELIARAALDGYRTAAVRCDAADRNTDFGALRALTENTELFCDEPAWSNSAAFAMALTAETRRGPVLVWIDDAQHLDTASFEALGPLLRDLAGQPVALLLSANDQPPRAELDEAVRRVGRDFPGAVVRLEALADDDLQQLARRALPDWSDEALARLGRRLAADTAGIPLLAVDLLHALRLGLELSDEGPRTWPAASHTLDDPFPQDVPAPLVAAVRVGFRRLGEDAQAVLKAAAVAEGRVDPQTLGQLTDLDLEEVHAALDELEWRRWLTAEPRGYSFLARLHRELIREDLMTRGERRRLTERLTGT